MASALTHRGPDEEGFHFEPGLGLASRRLSILGIEDGQQPVFNESRSVVAVYNGELFDYPEKREWLESRNHIINSHCDSELLEIGARQRGARDHCARCQNRKSLIRRND